MDVTEFNTVVLRLSSTDSMERQIARAILIADKTKCRAYWLQALESERRELQINALSVASDYYCADDFEAYLRIRNALSGSDPWVRHQACWALEHVYEVQRQEEKTLEDLLRDDNPHVRLAAASALGARYGHPTGQSSVGSRVQLLHGGASGKVVSREIAMLATCWPGGEFNGDRIRW
ncbi:MAG TPA: HEAT repeat domain-containing protein [Pirellulales bacterium]|nr:HEAT repeat domain-containing protein [Pirellulales bacterium]